MLQMRKTPPIGAKSAGRSILQRRIASGELRPMAFGIEENGAGDGNALIEENGLNAG